MNSKNEQLIESFDTVCCVFRMLPKKIQDLSMVLSRIGLEKIRKIEKY